MSLKVNARIKANPGKEKELEALFREMCKTVRANEPDAETELYAVHRVNDNPLMFVWLESFKDQAAFDKHRFSQHMKYAVDAIEELADGPPQFDFLTEIDRK